MATVKTMVSGRNKLVINVTGSFDTIDETNVVILDRTSISNPSGTTLRTGIRIDEITWAVGVGFDYVKLSFDHTTDEVIDYFQGQGYMDYRPYGGKSMTEAIATVTDGDVLLTTSGGAAGDTYSFLIHCTLKKK